MRQRRDYFYSEDEQERLFVRKLLALMAGGPLKVTEETWENAQKAWEIKVIQYTNEGRTYPEVAAANWLLVAAAAKGEVAKMRRFHLPAEDPE